MGALLVEAIPGEASERCPHPRRQWVTMNGSASRRTGTAGAERASATLPPDDCRAIMQKRQRYLPMRQPGTAGDLRPCCAVLFAFALLMPGAACAAQPSHGPVSEPATA